MLNEKPDLDTVFHALANPIRRAIIEQLAQGECTVSDLAAPHDVSKPAISQHLRVLEDAGLVTQQKDGRLRICTLQAAPLNHVFSWTLQYRVFWENILDQVQQIAEAPEKTHAKHP